MAQDAEERVLFWRAVGEENSFLPSSFLALCVTNRRVILLNLGSSLVWFLGLGPLGYAIGKKQAEKKAQMLRQKSPAGMLRECPFIDVVEPWNLIDIDVADKKLILRTKDHGERKYRFPDLFAPHARQLRSAMTPMGVEPRA
jgi:hypothetical protein